MSNIEIQTIKELMNECLKDIDLKEIEGIGICFPGTVTDTVVVKAENLGIYNLKIVEKLTKEYKIPMCLANDAKVAAIAEKEFGSLKNYSDSLFLIIGTGLTESALSAYLAKLNYKIIQIDILLKMNLVVQFQKNLEN